EEVEKEVLKIEAGKYYKTRDGRKVGPYCKARPSNVWITEDGNILNSRYSNGKLQLNCENDADLIAEWQDETTSPIRTVTRREIVPGVYGKVFINDYDELANTVSLNVKDDFGFVSFNAEELREAAHTLN